MKAAKPATVGGVLLALAAAGYGLQLDDGGLSIGPGVEPTPADPDCQQALNRARDATEALALGRCQPMEGGP